MAAGSRAIGVFTGKVSGALGISGALGVSGAGVGFAVGVDLGAGLSVALGGFTDEASAAAVAPFAFEDLSIAGGSVLLSDLTLEELGDLLAINS